MAILYKGDANRGHQWQALFADKAPSLPFRLWPQAGDPEEIIYLVAWEPPDNFTERFPNLQVVFSVGAGVDQFNLVDLPESVTLVRMLDPHITQGIVEYVTFAVLGLHRHMLDYVSFQRQSLWQAIDVVLAEERRVGIMGLGNLGRAVIKSLSGFGFPLYGWSRSEHSIDNVTSFAGNEQFPEFLSNCDILVCLLPLTDETREILNKETFDLMPKGAALVNAGRGGHMREQDLLTALNSGQLSGAVLDVLQHEPPSKEHSFWRHPRILMTPHIAAMTHSESAGRVLLSNVLRHQAGKAMQGVVRRELGY